MAIAVTEKDKLVNKFISIHPKSNDYGIDENKFTVVIDSNQKQRLPGIGLWRNHPIFDSLDEAKVLADFMHEINPDRNYCVVSSKMKSLYNPGKNKWREATSELYDIIKNDPECNIIAWDYEKMFVDAIINETNVRLQVQKIPE